MTRYTDDDDDSDDEDMPELENADGEGGDAGAHTAVAAHARTGWDGALWERACSLGGPPPPPSARVSGGGTTQVTMRATLTLHPAHPPGSARQAVAQREEVSQGYAEAGHEACAGHHARDGQEEQECTPLPSPPRHLPATGGCRDGLVWFAPRLRFVAAAAVQLRVHRRVGRPR